MKRLDNLSASEAKVVGSSSTSWDESSPQLHIVSLTLLSKKVLVSLFSQFIHILHKTVKLEPYGVLPWMFH